ncbi:MAG TPA: SDR family NAD(P)-dependent oxidoreductase [Rhodocyclaceae bacterium]|nr:SDR family NAD(P)-dependent oxidoreductase [Rhodocyclaceae bacterium]
MRSQQVIFITGCSSGIGAALADEFQQRGHRVYATARSEAALQALAARGLHAVALDVNHADSITAAMARVHDECGRIDLLINNAGYGQFGAMIDIGREALRRQFETNVFAPVDICRLALPLLRAAAAARIANIGSVSGVVTSPFAGAYCASKAALHAVSDALRMELAPFGIRVITVQPGGIVSQFGAVGEAQVCLPENSVYRAIEKFVRARARLSQQGASPVEDFARELATKLLSAHPAAEIKLGANSTRLTLFKRCLPTALLDRKMSKMFGLDRLTAR